MKKIDEYERWQEADANFHRVTNDADATPEEIRAVESEVLKAAAYCDRALAEIARTDISTEVAAIRTAAARDLAEAYRDHAHDPDTLKILSDLIYGTAELKIESRLTEWTPRTADFMN